MSDTQTTTLTITRDGRVLVRDQYPGLMVALRPLAPTDRRLTLAVQATRQLDDERKSPTHEEQDHDTR